MAVTLNLHRSVAIACPRCRELVNVICDGQCVWCQFGAKRPKQERRMVNKPRQGQH